MRTKLDRLLNFIVGAFLLLSSLIAVVWIVRFSGIKWSADEFAVSLWTTLLAMAKTWGPLFVPAATVIFVIKMLQTNVAHEVCALLEPKLHAIVSSSVSKAMSESLDKRIAEKTLLGIRSIYRGIAAYTSDSPEIWRMYQKSSRDFRDVSGLSNIEAPAHP